MTNVMLAIAGGGIGSALRYWLDGLVQRWSGSTLPYGTFAVNSLGCLLIGILMTSLEERFLGNPSLRIFLTIGILGGFTTFSTFSYETVEMLRSAEYFYAALNVSITLLTCLAATYAGMAVGKSI
jgi:CrcB protein